MACNRIDMFYSYNHYDLQFGTYSLMTFQGPKLKMFNIFREKLGSLIIFTISDINLPGKTIARFDEGH